MASLVNKWRIFCNVEGKWIYKWIEDGSTPSKCFTDTSHDVNSESMSIIDTINRTEINISAEKTKTKGNFKREGYAITVPAQQYYEQNIYFPYNVNILSTYVNITSELLGDTVNVYFIPDFSGSLTVDTEAGVNKFCVDPVTMAVLNHGFNLVLIDTITNVKEDLGEVVEIDFINKCVTTTNTNSKIFTKAETRVAIHVNFVKNMRMAVPGRQQVGGSKINASFVPASGCMIFKYYNSTPTVAKNLYYDLEYLY